MNKVAGIVWSEDAMENIPAEERARIEEIYQQEFAPAMDFEAAKEHIVPVLKPAGSKLVNWDMVPHTPLNGDIEVVYYYLPKAEEIPMVGINNAWLEEWKVPVTELHQAAVENLECSYVTLFKPIGQMLADMMDADLSPEVEEGSLPMFVLGNDKGVFGASMLLNERAMEALARRDDYYILPSSVHECILVPKNDRVNLKELQETVREVNKMLEPKDFLSDYVYRYDARTREIYRAEEEPERENAAKKLRGQAR